ncbi:MAG: biotin/lipoyl-containing protein [Eubacteriales bacterium]|nr:biotin/lipoyl-binding protein [Christensenellaceae bacterium]MDY3241457.1 biotin/lipoyl-containing protein [Eubacteriales bacterium]MCI7583985.1 biotin/lipoyl-binding protein [Christensenellaceae bacterium]MCI7769732.1 biotin/lipoyl-binding protein [Christensenellaceae bacterium]MDD6360897.1 biotin/lipoyl-binding protein [Christensenellaceae bacterium]
MRKFNIKVNGRPYEVEVEEIAGDVTVSRAPEVTDVVVPATPAVAEKPAPAPAAPVASPVSSDGVKVAAPMPGTLLDFKVANGATVKKGDVIIILEAMKMENEIVAPSDGKISFVASKGASVNTGDALAVIA